jgi:hypothetical protein
MGIGTGMRGKDLRVFCMVARQYGVYILVRHTNDASLGYIGKPGYYPKPATIKAKTADVDPPPYRHGAGAGSQTVQHRIAGLVPHPGFQPKVFAGAKMDKAFSCWADTLDVLHGAGVNIPATSPDTWAAWGKEHVSARSGWRWRIDVNPMSQHFGCLQIARDAVGWSYLHGDYDLKDVIVLGRESDNQRLEGKVQGAKNYTPLLPGREFETIRKALNDGIGADMFEEMKFAYFKHRDAGGSLWPDSFTRFLWKGNTLLERNFGARFGRIEAGYQADLTICSYDSPTPLVAQNLGGHLAFGMNAASVDSVMVNGQMVYQNRAFPFDVAPIYAQARKVAAQLWRRMDALP